MAAAAPSSMSIPNRSTSQDYYNNLLERVDALEPSSTPPRLTTQQQHRHLPESAVDVACSRLMVVVHRIAHFVTSSCADILNSTTTTRSEAEGGFRSMGGGNPVDL
jgi:hypothetical protein